MRALFGLIDTLLNLFSILLWIHVILSWVRPAQNQWINLLNSIVEPVLAPIRRFLQRYLPSQLQVFDFSPIACWLLISLVRNLFSPLRYL